MHLRTYNIKSGDFQVWKYSCKQFFSFILTEPLENGCFHKFPLIFTSIACSFIYYFSLEPAEAKTENCRLLFAGFYCILEAFSVSNNFLSALKFSLRWHKIQFSHWRERPFLFDFKHAQFSNLTKFVSFIWICNGALLFANENWIQCNFIFVISCQKVF